MADQKSTRLTWKVLERVHVSELEDRLNELTEQGYQIFKLEPKLPGSDAFVVVAFDAAKLAEAQGKAMLGSIEGLKHLLDGALPKGG